MIPQGEMAHELRAVDCQRLQQRVVKELPPCTTGVPASDM